MSERPSSALDCGEFEALLTEARVGSIDALGDLLYSHREYLLWLANHELPADIRTKAGPSDVVQLTFLRAQAGFGGFRGRSAEQLKGWLRQILLNQLANVERDYRATGKRQLAREAAIDDPSSFERRVGALADDVKSPSSVLRRDEETEELLAALNSLPEDYRLVVKLRYWQRMHFSAIGTQMGRSAEAARKLWARALVQLEKQLERQGDG